MYNKKPKFMKKHTFSNLEENTYMELNTTDLNNGIYFVVAYTSDGNQHNAKFIKE